MMTERNWMKTFGDNLAYQLREADMTQNELAERTGLTQASISRYVNGTQLPGIRAIVNIANVFDCTTDELINFDDRISQY